MVLGHSEQCVEEHMQTPNRAHGQERKQGGRVIALTQLPRANLGFDS